MPMSDLALYSVAFLLVVAAFTLAVRWRIIRTTAATQNRGLFRFNDGVKTREVDPIGVLIALEAHPKFRMDLDPKRALQDGDQDALLTMADAVRQAFSVTPFTQPGKPGLTVYECVELLAVFMLYVDLQKKSFKPTQTSAPSTESTSTDAGAPTTLDTSDSGSIAAELSPSTL
ncbi:MAG: hypothetical protein IT422_05130 [Pirellulaceae bacterium]|nr:hypothetical protein [Pirellulaceae bacterium]